LNIRLQHIRNSTSIVQYILNIGSFDHFIYSRLFFINNSFPLRKSYVFWITFSTLKYLYVTTLITVDSALNLITAECLRAVNCSSNLEHTNFEYILRDTYYSE